MARKKRKHKRRNSDEIDDTYLEGGEIDPCPLNFHQLFRKRWCWISVLVGSFAIFNIIFFLYTYGTNSYLSRNNAHLHQSNILLERELSALKSEHLAMKPTEQDRFDTISKIYEFISNPIGIPNHIMDQKHVGSSSSTLREIYRFISNEKTPLSSGLKLAIADFLFSRQCEDVKKVPLRGKDEWMGYFHLLSPIVTCETRYRLGSTGDGGKNLCNLHKLQQGNCIAYSFGAKDDISFDHELVNLMNCEIHLFDPTLKSNLQTGHKKIHFHNLGLGPITYDLEHLKDLEILYSKVSLRGKDVKSLTEISESMDHKKVDILKIDIEYGEIPVFEDFAKTSILETLNVKIILVEYHAPFSSSQEVGIIATKQIHDSPPSAHSLTKMRANHLFPFIKKLYDQGYYMYSSEQNSIFRRAIEYGFIHKSLL